VWDVGIISYVVERAVEACGAAATDLNNSEPLLRLVELLSCVDLIGRSSYARFSAAYRLQLVVEWLLATGHKGLLLFIDEVDNVVRQIHGKAHPGCFRTLAWYCSAAQLDALRVIFAMTPEMVDRLGIDYRKQYADSLNEQKTVRPDECRVYENWSKEVDELSIRGWDACPDLQPSQRLELFRRIASIHAAAWGTSSAPSHGTLRKLIRSPAFGTTRRWVRASVQLLDLLQQQRFS